MIRIVGQPRPEDDWLHRFRNFGEEIYVKLRDVYAVSIEEIDAAFDTFAVRNVPAGQSAAAIDAVAQILRRHHLESSVVAVVAKTEIPGLTVVLVTDEACGDDLWSISAGHDTWVVAGDRNRAAVEEIRTFRKGDPGTPSLTIWSASTPTASEEDWRGMLETIEIHHGDYSSSPPLDMLSVYGASLTPPVIAVLLEYDYATTLLTALGFVAFKNYAA